MIEATVERSGEIIMRRVFHDPSMSLDTVHDHITDYVKGELLNESAQCHLRVWFSNPAERTVR